MRAVIASGRTSRTCIDVNLRGRVYLASRTPHRARGCGANAVPGSIANILVTAHQPERNFSPQTTISIQPIPSGGHMTRLVCAAVLLVVSTTVATAQAPTGTIAGTVLDQVSAVVPGATVTVKNTATGLTRVVVSSAEGSFQVPSLPAGKYDVLVEMSGFQSTLNPADVVTGQTTTL